MNAEGERAIYSGQRLLGVLKPLTRGGVEAYAADEHGELQYVAKAADYREGAALIHNAHAARHGRARQETEQRRASA